MCLSVSGWSCWTRPSSIAILSSSGYALRASRNAGSIRASVSLWGRVFAAGYDSFVGAMERNFMGDVRRELLADASGRVIEIGSGTGVNLQHYPRTIEELVCTEPEEPMARRLRGKAADTDLRVRIVEAGAEKL